MIEPQSQPDNERVTVLERVAMALVAGLLGFLTGIFTWWAFSGIPGFDLRLFFPLSLLLSGICFLVGLWRPNATVELLGLVGQKVWSFSNQVLSWFRLLR